MRLRSLVRTAVALSLVALWLGGDLAAPLQARRGLDSGRAGRVGGRGGVRDVDARGHRDVRVDRDVHVHSRRSVNYHSHGAFWDEVEDEHDESVGAALIGGIIIGALVASPPKNAQPTVVQGQQYYYSDGNYYQASGDQYQVVAPPMGAEAYNLPAGAQRFEAGGNTYFKVGDSYYQLYYRGGEPIYQIVPNPLG